MNYDETNFRVLVVDAHALVKGTICAAAEHEVMDSLEEMNIYPHATISRIV